jgi:hypothetical protein
MKALFLLLNYNLNLDRRERQELRFILFSQFVVTLQNTSVPTISKWYERKIWCESNTTYFLLGGRITVSHVTFSPGAKAEYGL